jgi:hypothetical protein
MIYKWKCLCVNFFKFNIFQCDNVFFEFTYYYKGSFIAFLAVAVIEMQIFLQREFLNLMRAHSIHD